LKLLDLFAVFEIKTVLQTYPVHLSNLSL